MLIVKNCLREDDLHSLKNFLVEVSNASVLSSLNFFNILTHFTYQCASKGGSRKFREYCFPLQGRNFCQTLLKKA